MQFNLGRAVGRSPRPPSSKAKARSNLPPFLLPPPPLPSQKPVNGFTTCSFSSSSPASARSTSQRTRTRQSKLIQARPAHGSTSVTQQRTPPGPSSSVSHNPSSPRLASLALSSGLKPDSLPSSSQFRAQNGSSLDRGTHRWLSSADLSWRPPSSKLPFVSPPFQSIPYDPCY